MEDRRPIYYEGNTVAPAHPGRKNRNRRLLYQKTRYNELQNKMMPREPKVCMTRICVWCNNNMHGYHAICPLCYVCQYCGLISNDRNCCTFCDNIPPEEFNHKHIVKRVRA